MEKIYFLLVLFVAAGNTFAQTVTDSLVRDSVPILLTDTTSYNTHARIMVYSGNYSDPYHTMEDSATAYLLFYDKQPDTATYSSIWYRELRTMTPETVFLQSNDSVQYSNPQATNSGVIFYEEKRDSTIAVKGLLIDPLTMNGLDTITVCTIQSPVKMVANAWYVFWLKDSILCRQQFSITGNTVSLDALDTLSIHATDICVADFISNSFSEFYGDFAYLSYENNQTYLFKGDSYILDSGLISDIHFNYTNFLYYKKAGVVYTYPHFYSNEIPIVLYDNDTLTPEYAVADEGITYSKTSGALKRMAFVPDSFSNVFNFAASDYQPFNASDTFVFSDPIVFDDGLYAYPFPAGDTVRNLIMHRGYIIYLGTDNVTWDLKIVFEVTHDSVSSLYMVRSSVSDIGGNVTTQENLFSVNLFPNPAMNNLTISINNAQLTINNISILDLTGKQIMSSFRAGGEGISSNAHKRQNIPAKAGISTPKYPATMDTRLHGYVYRVDIETLPAGIYFVKVETDKGTVVKKFVKQ